jgi:hypothetical protein
MFIINLNIKIFLPVNPAVQHHSRPKLTRGALEKNKLSPGYFINYSRFTASRRGMQ